MSVHKHAGQKASPSDLENIPLVVSHYYLFQPDVKEIAQRVKFGTSGHRGNASNLSFNEHHIIAICQAIAEYRHQEGIDGPLFLGKDTHALSEPAFATALSVLIANNVPVIVQEDLGFTPTPVISRLIVDYNNSNAANADGIIITPSHNPPADGGIKYNPPHGGPAEGEITALIERRANDIIQRGLLDAKQSSYQHALTSPLLRKQDFIGFYVAELSKVINLKAISEAGVTIGADPMGGSGIHYWPAIAEHYHLALSVVNENVDPSFSFMTLDKDGKIRMDCSSPYAMASLIELKDSFDIAVGNDADFDRHGIVTKTGGLMNPNHFLAVAIHYLMTHRSWPEDCKIGKTLVSSSMIDRVAASLNKPLAEVPVGFKWFVEGLHSGEYAFGGEESAGATFLALDGSCWTTDKDGFVMALLAAEILAVTGKDPQQYYNELAQSLGEPCYKRNEAVASYEQKQVFSAIDINEIEEKTLADEPIKEKMTHAPANGAAIGGIKITAENGWFAARPSGTEDIYKIYAESFISEAHLDLIIHEAQHIVNKLFTKNKA
ncbi:phosphoglucomutase (alpha-D-glucose-1,6-bisphosphate-dependent) [Thalassotalea sediminis]|uniref:phosphoglucomutase (alpha-D-glucose-1,6-bisphosphate-dependent) n=1 Tax=Thalassotalea sediminis TaxID=1759089 RepID=UPI002573012A|nr:phosphoglucomutase (alpha-D-glucose-1,6-bisphosphate-dependent) [Thalassotalea sediminis]